MLKKSYFYTIMAAVAAVVVTSSCQQDSTFRGWEYMPDMYRGPALESYAPHQFFEDSLSARKPVKGTVPRGFMAYREFSAGQGGYDSAKANLEMPENFPTDSATLAEGGKLFGIFCQQCHGKKGDGKGILVEREKILGVPSYADREINYGSIFHVITYGKGVMGSHASQVTPEERWKLAQYVMKLRSDLVGGSEEESSDKEASAKKDEGKESKKKTG